MAALDSRRGAGPHWAWPQGLTDFARRAAQRVREWAVAEVAPGRLVPWLAIAFGWWTIIYFAVEREPAPWAASPAARRDRSSGNSCAGHRPFAFPATLGIAPWRPGLRPSPSSAKSSPIRADGAGMERRAWRASSSCAKSASDSDRIRRAPRAR